jgi:hypothetical protein
LPPFLIVFLQKVGSDRDIAYRCIEPDIKDLVLELFNRHRYTPFEISSDALRLKTHVDPTISDVNRVGAPYFRGLINPSFKLTYYFWQFDEKMSSFLDNWLISAHIALILNQLSRRVEQFLTFVALVSSGFRILTKWAVSDNESISKEHTTVLTETLSHG